MYRRRKCSYSTKVYKSSTYHPILSYHSSDCYSTTSFHHASREYHRLNSDNYISSYLIRKGSKKIAEFSKDYNFEEYFRILPPSLYTRYYDSHKFLNKGKRFFPNLRLELGRLYGLNCTSLNSSSLIVSTPSLAQSCIHSRSSSPINRLLSPSHFNYDINDKSVDDIQLSRTKSFIESVNFTPLCSHLTTLLGSNKRRTKSESYHSGHEKKFLNVQDSNISKKSMILKINDCKKKNKKNFYHESNQSNSDCELYADITRESMKNLISQTDDSNLIKILNRNIIELIENLNFFFGNEHNRFIKSIQSNDNDFIEKIDQLKNVSERLKACTMKQAFSDEKRSDESKSINLQIVENLANQLDTIECGSHTDNLKIDQFKLESAECELMSPIQSDNFEIVQIHQQEIIEPIIKNKKSKVLNDNENNLDKHGEDKTFEQINVKQANQSHIDKQMEREESRDDEFFECISNEQKDLRKFLFKNSKLNLEKLIDKAVNEQLLGQWLKLSDSMEEDGAILEQKHSIEELKHKFATKLAIIHYKLYQKYSKSKSIRNAKKWRHQKLNKCNKLQSKYTLLQDLMDDDQFIQFLMDKINYFMCKIRQCKIQRRERKKSIIKFESIESTDFDFKDQNENNNVEFVKDENSVDKLINENNKLKILSSETNYEISIENQFDLSRITTPNKEMITPNETENKLNENEFCEKLNKEFIKDFNNEFNNNYNEIIRKDRKKKQVITKYIILFIITLIIFMILIVMLQLFSFVKVNKRCVNCVHKIDANELLLQPVKQMKKIKHTTCDRRIMLEAQRLLDS